MNVGIASVNGVISPNSNGVHNMEKKMTTRRDSSSIGRMNKTTLLLRLEELNSEMRKLINRLGEIEYQEQQEKEAVAAVSANKKKTKPQTLTKDEEEDPALVVPAPSDDCDHNVILTVGEPSQQTKAKETATGIPRSASSPNISNKILGDANPQHSATRTTTKAMAKLLAAAKRASAPSAPVSDDNLKQVLGSAPSQQTTMKLTTTTKRPSMSQPNISKKSEQLEDNIPPLKPLSNPDDNDPVSRPIPPQSATSLDTTTATTATTLAMAKLLSVAKRKRTKASRIAASEDKAQEGLGGGPSISKKEESLDKNMQPTLVPGPHPTDGDKEISPLQSATTLGTSKTTTLAMAKLLAAAKRSSSGKTNITAPSIPTNPPQKTASFDIQTEGSKSKKTKSSKLMVKRSFSQPIGEGSTVSFPLVDESIGRSEHSLRDESIGRSESSMLDESIGLSTRSMPALSERNSNNYVPTSLKDAFKKAPKHKWHTTTERFSGELKYLTLGEEKFVEGKSISKAIKKFQESPHKYYGLIYQTNMRSRPSKQQSYTFIMREGTTALRAANVDNKTGWLTLMINHYQHLPAFPPTSDNNNQLPPGHRDGYSQHPAMMTYNGQQLPPPLLPGRGMGVGDVPTLKIIGDIDPCDIYQGSVADCWLMGAISAIAEFDGAIKHIFRKTDRIDEKPLGDGTVNFYTISLWDISTWTEVDYVIDESLCADPDGSGQLLAARISEDGELWVPYLEKALAIHCGGWDEIRGGQCTHAWAILTGCVEQYTIERNWKTGKFYCTAKFDTAKQQWAKHANSPKKNKNQRWKVPWPQVGGGGEADLELTEGELYQRMVAWDKEDYIVGATTKVSLRASVSQGMVGTHAYAVLDCYPQVAGTNIDLMCVRNPWGSGEMEVGKFDDNGSGWDEYPQIKNELKPEAKDDGKFYLTKEEFFKCFQNVYVCAKSMPQFKED